MSDEISLYRGAGKAARAPFAADGLAGYADRKPQSLSGGEQMRLALHCFSVSPHGAVAIDTALEQLDHENRIEALAYLERCAADVALIDNRLADLPGWARTERTAATPQYVCDWPKLIAHIEHRPAPVIEVSGLCFRYRHGNEIFRDASATLEPGHAYRLLGANGAGKTTFLKILVGALAPSAGGITLDGARYEPWRGGNVALALATQNPDQQWCGATLREDMGRRRSALRGRGEVTALEEPRLETLAKALGIASLDQHLYELPLAARKRLSWLWPLAGAHPWVMLDEPTLGQDADTRARLADLIAVLCAAGYGVLFVSHDDEFAARLHHRMLRVADKTITSE